MALFPGALPAAGTASSSATLAAAGHTSLHNTGADEARAIATKVGTGSSTPAANQVLRGTSSGVSAWGQVALSTEVSGTLPVANGGTGTTTSTGSGSTVLSAAPALTGGGSWSGSPTISTPIIADFTNATHSHANNAGGGQLNGANAITDGTITPAQLATGTGASWAWQSWTPTLSGLFDDADWTKACRYIQIGKTVFYELSLTATTTTPFGGAGGAYFTLPVTSRNYGLSANEPIIGDARFNDVGTAAYRGHVELSSTTLGIIRLTTASGTYLSVSDMNTTVPFSWTTNDVLYAQGFYEAA